MKTTALSNARGFSTIQLVITIAVMTIVAGFAVVSISRARDHVRLINSARQFAAYVERARGDSVRRHAGPANQSTVAVADDNTYSVTMDWDGFGNLSTRNFDLEQGIVFTPGMVGKSVSFDWRGRIASEQSFGFDNGRDQINVHVTGSGDVTFDTDWFFDRLIPTSPITGTGGPVTPEPGASPLPPAPPPTPTPTPTPNQNPPAPPPDQNPPPPPPDQNPPPPPPDQNPPPPPPDQNPPPPPPDQTPPPPPPCTINGPDSITIVSDSSATVSVNRTNVAGTGTISANSSNSGQIQVSPSSQTVSGTAAGSFTITVKKNSGSVTFSSTGCISKTVDITVQ